MDFPAPVIVPGGKVAREGISYYPALPERKAPLETIATRPGLPMAAMVAMVEAVATAWFQAKMDAPVVMGVMGGMP